MTSADLEAPLDPIYRLARQAAHGHCRPCHQHLVPFLRPTAGGRSRQGAAAAQVVWAASCKMPCHKKGKPPQ